MKTNDLTAQLALLIKAADRHRVTTRKLVAAAKDVGDAIEALVPVGVPLPGAYERVEYGNDNSGYASFLLAGCPCEDDSWGECSHTTGHVNSNQSGYLYGDFQLPELEKTTRAVALRFAKDISEGLIGKFAEFLQTRAGANENAIATLTNVAEALAAPTDVDPVAAGPQIVDAVAPVAITVLPGGAQ